jgi:hypothetical protein
MKIVILILLILHLQLGFGQSVNWSQTKDWVIYDIHDDNAFNYSLDTLHHFKSNLLGDSIIHRYLKDGVAWPIDKSSLWMGLYVTTCQFEDGTIHKIDISVYGGFFFEEQSKSYYEVSSESRKQWLHYFHDCLAKLSSGNQ